ncbi:hypothetical protein GLOTRDRAFT_131461 [Gloeophyllum trabeum ATCC 11539]|uniref:HNH nuclease domain-containing protein n=1 Tax=Gloeophyllum trabeum (strain ATCC 11539 / FP-39264 / Madison 617) TaxID=670483 RepID=S7PZT0_GLOTA|nr:uncharacterized protein GLOTRDRAFT_131461 [Gloeophyllum trabeum ATCC 11539]EPQ53181.1 hypothetical protein GLOTRDRAFT_131461 [Gloeophyllum trabeum ATCC 11539]
MEIIAAGVNRQLAPLIPELCKALFEKRKKTASQTPSGASSKDSDKVDRNSAVVNAVRKRDKACRVSGIPAVDRKRGRNFTEFHVAHVIPLFATGMIVNSPLGTQLSITSPTDIDVPTNAMLMRADIHALFDDYQFGIDAMTSMLYRFEKSGAPFLEGRHTMAIPLGTTGLAAEPEVRREYLRDHFRTCLLWHFKGGGQKARPNPTIVS